MQKGLTAKTSLSVNDICEQINKAYGTSARVKVVKNGAIVDYCDEDAAGRVRITLKKGPDTKTTISVAPIPSTAAILPLSFVKLAIFVCIYFSVGIIPAILFLVVVSVGLFFWGKSYWTTPAQKLFELLQEIS